MGGRDLKVTSLNVRSAQPIVHDVGDWARSYSLDSLTWANASNFAILKGGEEPGENGSWPRDIVVGHDDDGCFHLWDRLANLDPLVCNGHLEYLDIRGFKSLDEGNELGVLVRGRHKQELERITCQNALDGFSQLFKIVVNRGNDDRDILLSVRRLGRNWDRFVTPMAVGVDNEADVTVQPADFLSQ